MAEERRWGSGVEARRSIDFQSWPRDVAASVKLFTAKDEDDEEVDDSDDDDDEAEGGAADKDGAAGVGGVVEGRSLLRCGLLGRPLTPLSPLVVGVAEKRSGLLGREFTPLRLSPVSDWPAAAAAAGAADWCKTAGTELDLAVGVFLDGMLFPWPPSFGVVQSSPPPPPPPSPS